MISVIDRNEILNKQLINTDDIDGVLRERKAMGSSPDPNEIKLGPCVVTQVKTISTDGYSAVQLAFDEKKEKLPIVLYSLYLTIEEIDKVFINSIKISGKDIKFIHTDKNQIFITLTDIDFCDDIVIDYNTRQDLRENKINELVK